VSKPSPATLPLRERKKQQVRRDILAAAGRLIEERGYPEARMREIARTAHVSYQTLYNYFPTKALILQALLTQDLEHVATAVDALIDGYAGALLETLDAINRVRLDVISHRDRDLWRVVSIELFRNQHQAGHVYQLIDAAAHEKLRRLLNTAQAAAHLDPGVDTELLANTLFALSQHASSQYMLEPSASKTALLETLHDQTALLVTPYLREC
jgi:AcrR family transcriptional regulator